MSEPTEPERRTFVPVAELQRKWRDAPKVDYAELRAEADEFFGGEDRVGDDPNPWDRSA